MIQGENRASTRNAEDGAKMRRTRKEKPGRKKRNMKQGYNMEIRKRSAEVRIWRVKTYANKSTLRSSSTECRLLIDNRSKIGRRPHAPELRNNPLGRVCDGEAVGDSMARRLGVVGEGRVVPLNRG